MREDSQMEVKRLVNRHLLYVAAALLALLPGGCLWVAAGAAGGAAVGAAYCYGKVCQTFPSSLDDSVAAAKTALSDLGMPMLEDRRDSGTAFIKSQTSDGDAVRIYLDPEVSKFPADGPLTKVTVRVAAFGDHPVSNRVLDQIAAHLTPAPLASAAPSGMPVAAAGTVAPSAIRQAGAGSAPPQITAPPPPPGTFPPTTAPPPELPPEPAPK
jgi:hypothetical protein